MCLSTSSATDEHITLLDKRAAWLDGRQRNDTSQFGEDGLIEAVFERIGTANEWCFEVGAADGLFYSNTKRLRDAGWRSVLIEADTQQYAVLSQLENARTYTFNQLVGRKSLDHILESVAAPISLDLGVIDVDGQDYWVWKGMQMFRPRVMLVEFIYANNPAFIPDEGGEGQAGLDAIVELGRTKGYTALVRTYCNVLFARSDCLK